MNRVAEIIHIIIVPVQIEVIIVHEQIMYDDISKYNEEG